MAQEATVVDSGRSQGWLGRVPGLWFSPGETFVSIVRRPLVLFALAAGILLNVAFTATWLSKVDMPEFVKGQMEEHGQMERIPAEARAEAVERGASFTKGIYWVAAFVGVPIFVVVVAGVLYFVFRFFYASEVSFVQAMGIVAWSGLAVSILTLPLTLLTIQLKGDWSVNPQEVLQANPTLLFEKADTAKPLWAILGSIDLFSFWLIALLAIGFGVASRRATGSALWGVVVPWAVVVLIKVGFSFFQ
jgi:hypothetical protein